MRLVWYPSLQRPASVAPHVRTGGDPSAMLAGVCREVASAAPEALRPVLAGAVGGVLQSWGASRVLQGYLIGCASTDPILFGVAALLPMLVAALAVVVVANRAVAVDPMAALRTD